MFLRLFFLQRFYKRAAAFVLRAVSKHSPTLAQAVVDAGSLAPLTHCLAEFEPSVKEAAAWALGYIARHNAGMILLLYALIFTFALVLFYLFVFILSVVMLSFIHRACASCC